MSNLVKLKDFQEQKRHLRLRVGIAQSKLEQAIYDLKSHSDLFPVLELLRAMRVAQVRLQQELDCLF